MGAYSESFFVVYLIVIIVAIFAGLLWIFLPFAVFGTRPSSKLSLRKRGRRVLPR
jgi:hypothetical protein